MRSLFKSFDVDNDNMISYWEVQTIRAWLGGLGLGLLGSGLHILFRHRVR